MSEQNYIVEQDGSFFIKHKHVSTVVACPKCGTPNMVLRLMYIQPASGPLEQHPFLGCSAYPHCTCKVWVEEPVPKKIIHGKKSGNMNSKANRRS
jgi:ssDNA-binding Zn-finger/Zn-ribbon topoisomerase 1